MVETSKIKEEDLEDEEEENVETEPKPVKKEDSDDGEEEEVDEESIAKGNKSAVYSLVVTGKWHMDENGTIVVTEIPIGVNYAKYDAFLHRLKEEGEITDKDNLCTDADGTRFEIKGMDSPSDKKLKLRTVVKLSNMNIIDENGSQRRFNTLNEIGDYWYEQTIKQYIHRRKTLMVELKEDVTKLKNKAEFLRLIIEGEIKLGRRPKAEVLADAEGHGIDTQYIKGGMDLWSLTKEDEDKLRTQLEGKQEELATLKGKRPEDLLLEDLDELEAVL